MGSIYTSTWMVEQGIREWRWVAAAAVLVALLLLLVAGAMARMMMVIRRWMMLGRRIRRRRRGNSKRCEEEEEKEMKEEEDEEEKVRRREVIMKAPPSPRGVGIWSVPWFGHLLHLLLFSGRGMAPHRWFQWLSRRNVNGSSGQLVAPLLFLWLGRVPTLLVSSAAAARLVLHQHDLHFASRPITTASRLLLYGSADLAFTPYGPYWRKVKELYMTKLFNVTRLREFMPIRAQELSRLISSVSADMATPQVIRTKLFDMAFDNICRMAFGATARDITNMFYGSSLDFTKATQDLLDLLGAFNIGDFLPALRWLDLQGYERQMKQTHRRLDLMLQRIIDDRRAEGNKGLASNENPTVLDVLLSSDFHPNDLSKSQDDCIKAMILDFFVGGTDTIVTTIEWALSELLKNKDIMDELREELDNALGTGQIVSESCILNLPFLQAVVKETLRLHTPVPLLIAHEAIRPCNVDGYFVQEKTRVFVNAWAIARDESSWEKPLEFSPRRFLNNTMDVKGHHYQLLPFGAGRRSCPAMNLGLLSTQLVLAALIHGFQLSLPNGVEEIDMSERYSLTLHKAVPLIIMATPRMNVQ